LSVLCGACRSVPVLVTPQWPLEVDELDAYHSSSRVRPVQPRGWNLRTAEFLTDEMMLHPLIPGRSIISDVKRRACPRDCA
jgi:hypothetical protein